MHMTDALVSPAVGGFFWMTSAAAVACCSAHLRKDLDLEQRVPLMAVLGAFVFAVQMINFAIPGTGSSGHLSGGLLLAILLGPAAGFLTIASVLVVQSLFFADGGLLSLGCNLFNLGIVPAFVAYPLIYKTLLGFGRDPFRWKRAAIAAALVALQLGALGVVVQTFLSGVAIVPIKTFLWLMQPIHLAIGVVEGLVTALVIAFVCRARPEFTEMVVFGKTPSRRKLRSLAAIFFSAAILAVVVLPRFASQQPDGLEWSFTKAVGNDSLAVTETASQEPWEILQQKTVLLPNYRLPDTSDKGGNSDAVNKAHLEASLAGLIGGGLTLAFCILIGTFLKKRSFRGRGGRPLAPGT